MTRRVNFFLLFIPLIIVSVSVGCQNSVDNPTTYNPTENPITNSNISKKLIFNITDATNLFIGKSFLTTNRAVSSRIASNNTGNKLFKITETGYIQEVTYNYEVVEKDDEGNIIEISTETTTETFEPSSFYDINNDYLFVCFESDSYLVRKTDGSAFILPSSIKNPEQALGDFVNSNLVKFSNNSLYYLINESSQNRIVKIKLTGIESLVSQIISPSTDSVNKFDVDKNGNVIYWGHNSSNSGFIRIIKENGGLKNLNGVWNFWIGLDGNIYFDSDGTESYPIKRVIVSEENVETEVYGNIENHIPGETAYKLELEESIIMIFNSIIYEVYNNTNTPRKILLSDIAIYEVLFASVSENFYYIAGIDTNGSTFLIKVNPRTDEYNHLINKNEFEIYSFTASESEGIIFNALRMSDGKKIIGKVGIDGGEVTVLDEESDTQIYYLQRIN